MQLRGEVGLLLLLVPIGAPLWCSTGRTALDRDGCSHSATLLYLPLEECAVAQP